MLAFSLISMNTKGYFVAINERDAALIKGMVARGDKQSDIAAWFRINQGTVSKIAKGMNVRFRKVPAAEQHQLPPPGPYQLVNQMEYSALITLRTKMMEMVQALEAQIQEVAPR